MHLVADRRVVAAHCSRSADAVGQRGLSAWIGWAALASFAALAVPFLLGRVYVADDLGEFHLPLRSFYAQQLRAGEPFDWMPSLYGGFYVTGEGQLGAYHPLHLLLYRWLPLGAAFDLELLLSYPLMFSGMFLFLKTWLARRDAALFGALVFTFGGFNLLHFVHPNAVASVAHIPWLLLAIEATLTQPDGPRRSTAELAFGLLTASQLLLGYPQFVWFSLLTEAAYAVWRATKLHVSLARVVMLIMAMVLGAATAAVQLLPTMHFLGDSTRSASDVAFANTGALHPLNLVQLVAPYLFQTRVVGQNTHELGLYAGAVPLVLCLWLLATRRRWGRFAPLVWATLIFGGLALLLAFGHAGGLYRLQSFLPLVNHFRFPCRAIVLVQLCIAVGAATAIAILRQRAGDNNRRENRRADRILAIAIAASIVLAIIGPMAWPQYVASPILVWCGPPLVVAAVALVALAERNARGAWVALVVFTAADLSCYGVSYSVWNRTADLHEFVAEIPLPPGKSRGRVAAEETGGLRTGNRMLLAGLQRVDGYAGLEPRKRLDYSTTGALRLAGASYLLQPASSATETKRRWTAIEPTAPRVRLVTRTVASDRAHDLEALGLDTAAVDDRLEFAESAPGMVRMLVDRPGHIALECHTPARQLLVTTESFHSGWRARVDGRVQPVVRVNGDFLGCVVDGGTHNVDFAFRPGSLLLGECCSAGGLGLLLCAFALRLRGRKSWAH